MKVVLSKEVQLEQYLAGVQVGTCTQEMQFEFLVLSVRVLAGSMNAYATVQKQLPDGTALEQLEVSFVYRTNGVTMDEQAYGALLLHPAVQGGELV